MDNADEIIDLLPSYIHDEQDRTLHFKIIFYSDSRFFDGRMIRIRYGDSFSVDARTMSEALNRMLLALLTSGKVKLMQKSGYDKGKKPLYSECYSYGTSKNNEEE